MEKGTSEASKPDKVEKTDKVTIGVTEKSRVDPTIKQVQAEKKNIANQYFELGAPYDFLPTDLKDKLDTIDTFIDQQISEKGEKHTLSNYVKTLDGLKVEMFAGEEMTTNEEIELLAGYAKNIMKLNGLTDKEYIQRIKNAIRGKKSVDDMNTVVLRRIGKLIT